MLGGVGKSGRKFLFAGRGMSVRTGRYLGEATLVGAATGLAVVVFKWMIDFAHRLHGMLAAKSEFTWTSPARTWRRSLPWPPASGISMFPRTWWPWGRWALPGSSGRCPP